MTKENILKALSNLKVKHSINFIIELEHSDLADIEVELKSAGYDEFEIEKMRITGDLYGT